jgi:hypothetical protein
MSNLSQVFRLPGGYVATFHWPNPAGEGWSVERDPSVPRIRSRRLHRKFLAAYSEARHQFLTTVATSLGGGVLVIDIDGQAEVVLPATKQ